MKLSPVLSVAAALLLSACTRSAPDTPVADPVMPATAPVLAPAEVVHTSRYTLVSLTPDETLRFPLRQIVTHTLPAAKKNHHLTRGNALHIWLSGSGYRLCAPDTNVTNNMHLLLNSPLPGVWRSAGPLRISDALQSLAGEAWEMVTDELTRTVCFRRTVQTADQQEQP